MAFDRPRPSRPAPRRTKTEGIFAVGGRVFIHHQMPGPVPLVDGNGAPVGNDLRDGQQVEIVSWRPRSREGLAYQVRRLADGSEWWIAAQYLRREAVATPPADAGSTALK